ncbi:MAG: LamG-like jellyroll fold domain-containing protein [Polyangiaceae bacterium]
MSKDIVITVPSKDFTASGPGTLKEDPDHSDLTVTPGEGAGYIEWKVTLPVAGKWRLRARMTTAEPRPCSLTLNGAKQAEPILGEVTGSFYAEKLGWFAYGPYDLDAGENLVRLDFEAGHPHLEALEFSELPPCPVLSFDGEKSHVEVADPFEDDTAFSLCLWARTSILDDGRARGLAGKRGDPLGKPSLWLGPSNGALHYEALSPTGEVFSGKVDGFFEKDRWTHVAWVKRGTKFDLYKDGQLVAQGDAPARFYSRRSSYWIGKVDDLWAGQICHVRVFAASRDRAEILSDMHRTVDLTDPALVSCWLFDEGEGTTARDKASRAAHGATMGAAWTESAVPFLEAEAAAKTGSTLGFRAIGGPLTDIAARRSPDGRIVVAGRGEDGALHLLSQSAPSSAEWVAQQNLGGGFKGPPVLALHADGRLLCAAIGVDGQIYSRQQTAPGAAEWATFKDHPGCELLEVVAAENADGRIVLLGRGNDEQLWHTAQTEPNSDTWSAWEAVGGALRGAPAAARTGKGRIEIFACGAEGDLWHAWQDTPGANEFRPWHPLGGHIVGAPAIGLNADGRFQIFAQGADNALWHIAQIEPNGLWGDWVSLGAGSSGAITGPVVVTGADGRLVVFARGADSAAWSIRQATPGGDFEGWTCFAGEVSSIAAALDAGGRVALFAVGPDSQLQQLLERTAGGGFA